MPGKSEFVSKFIQFNKEHHLLEPNDKIIIAVSGGPDSMALLNLLHELNYSIIAAHVNYGLRADESNEDENFVRNFCRKKKIPIEILHCKTEQIAQSIKKGIQETAREIRYDWFNELSQKSNFNKIATAHHQEDQLESILLNISRGTGINGLSGIHLKRGKIIRPFLFANKSDILAYLDENNIHFRTDSSNAKNKYKRNYLRNEIIPGLKKLNPQITQHAFDLSQWAIFYQNLVDSNQKNRLQKARFKEQFVVPISEVLSSDTPFNFLMNEIGKFGFTSSQAKDIVSKIMAHQKGQLFESKTHLLVIEKSQLLIDTIPVLNVCKEISSLPFVFQTNGMSIQFKLLKKFPKKYEQDKLYLNADFLVFPLELSTIKKGDKMTPIGMKGSKKISDILIDEKVNKLDKNLCLNLKQDNEILALIPLKINERFVIKKDTKNILCISIN